MVRFSIPRWSAWAPGLDTPDAWRLWARGGGVTGSATEPDSSFVPAGTRRRLSPLARTVFAVARDVVDEGESMPTVFASRHGELDRTVELLSAIARDQDLSPTSFGLSVHNAIVGQWSMFRGDRSEATAIAAVGDALELAVLEAVALHRERPGPVLVLFAEAEVPAPYGPQIGDVPFRHALALRVEPGDDWGLELSPSAGAASADSGALAWLRAVGTDQRTWARSTDRAGWTWSRS